MKAFSCIVALLLLLSSFAFAQTTPPTNEVFLERQSAQLTDKDQPWTQWYTSNRFQLLYNSSEAPITESAARTALNNLEDIFDSFVYTNGFRHPYEGRANNQRYKMCVYVLRPGDGHAFGGVTGNPGGPGMWLSSGATDDKWALAHEFMHGLQSMAGGMGGGDDNQSTNFRGWFYESHANLMPHVVYPNEVHYCAEMYTRMPQAYLGSTRNRYCNWQFFEYAIHRYGVATVNKIWETAQSGANHDPFTELMAKTNPALSQKDFGDVFGDFATKMVIHNINQHIRFGETTLRNSSHATTAYANRSSQQFRTAYNGGSVAARLKRSRYTYLEELPNTPAGNNAAGNRYAVPFAAAPQRYAFNIIRLYPDAATGTVTVKFRGDVQTTNNIQNYARNHNFEPALANLPNNPGSDWRYGLVAVTGDATGTASGVSARYSELKRSSDGNPDISVTMQSGETQLYLVVAATPTVHHKITWDQFYYTIYRFPYMVEINGAKPEGFQTNTTAGKVHGNGGGFVANSVTVPATVYVGSNARVTGGTVSGNARIEDRAIVAGGTIRGEAIVRGHAYISAGTIEGNAIIEEGANIWGGTFNQNARVGGIANVRTTGTISGNAHISGAPWIEGVALNMSGTGKLYGDGEVYGVTISSGAYTGIVDAGVIGQALHGSNRADFPVEVTKPRTLIWPTEPGDSSSDDTGTSEIFATVPLGVQFFNLSNRGIFSYNLGEVTSATLKVFDSRGRLLKAIPLNGAQGAVDVQLNTTAVLLWIVEGNNGKVISPAKLGTVIGR